MPRRIRKTQGKLLTTAEAKLWDALKTHNTVAFSAQSIGLKAKTAYNMLYRMRQKYLKARRYVNFVEGAKRHSGMIKMVMTSRMELAERDEEEELGRDED